MDKNSETKPAYRDRPFGSLNGFPFLLAGIAVMALGLYLLATGIHTAIQPAAYGRAAASGVPSMTIGALLLIAGFFVNAGTYQIEPNEAVIVTFFGAYKGTDSSAGYRWAIPLYHRQRISKRILTSASPTLKVNDMTGSPIEIGAAAVWRVSDAAKAVLTVENFKKLVEIQLETSLRKLASSHPYDARTRDEKPVEDGKEAERLPVTLLSGGQVIADEFVTELSSRLESAGIEIIEARITHLAYAPEIASAMLRYQQAEAVLAARRKIVEGAVEIVGETIENLSKKKIDIDEDKRAALVNNLLVVLVSDRDATPVVNSGSVHG